MSAATLRPPSPSRRAVKLFFRTPSGVVGLCLVLVVIAAAVFAPYLAPYNPIQ